MSPEHPRHEWRGAEASERASAIDAELSALLPALQRTEHGRVVVLAQVRRVEFVGLIPFQLHARWPDALHWLPLTATVAVIPFSAADLAVACLPLYRVSDVRAARLSARSTRHTESRNFRDDFVHPDWEAGAARLRGQLDHILLPACAFVSIERVRNDGGGNRMPRPTLGRHADRHAPRPRVLTPGARGTSTQAVEALASADLVVVDLQRLRGKRSLQTVQALLAARPAARPTLIVASSPSDLFAAGFDDAPRPDRFVLFGSPAPLESVEVVVVARDRLAADERFHAALRHLAGQSITAGRLVDLAHGAWWAIRQAVDSEGGIREVRRFERALEELAREDALTAALFTACRDLLHGAAADSDFRVERRRSAVDAVLQPGTSGGVLVLCRNSSGAAMLRDSAAAELDLKAVDLEDLGVWMRTVYAPPRIPEPEVAVLVGYSGMVTIDAALASGARRVRAIFDPVEARTAWYNVQRMADYLDAAGATEAAGPLRRLADALSPHVVGFAPVRDLVPVEGPVRAEGGPYAIIEMRPRPDEAIVCLIDGTELEVPLGRRFEVLGRKGLGSRVVAVSALEPGDNIVMLDEEARALFSEGRIAALDAGVLKEQSAARSDWLTIIGAVTKEKKLTAAAITRELTARGYRVTQAAVRGWMSEDPQAACVPMRIEGFLALADVLGLRLPRETLCRYYHDIHTWRVRHRRAGHQVAQAMRLAYAGRLGSVTLARIERDWGVGVRSLVAAARIGVVDEVILPAEA